MGSFTKHGTVRVQRQDIEFDAPTRWWPGKGSKASGGHIHSHVTQAHLAVQDEAKHIKPSIGHLLIMTLLSKLYKRLYSHDHYYISDLELNLDVVSCYGLSDR